MGLYRAGFDVLGMDKEPQPYYPFKFKKAWVQRLPASYLRQFDLIWASPPCQRWSQLNVAVGNRSDHPDLVAPTRDILLASGVPYIMENVPKAPLRTDVLLCGSMFRLRLVRHRIFEIEGFKASQPKHRDHHYRYVTVAGSTGGISSRVGTTGHGDITDWYEAMGIDWLPSRSLNQAVPPAFAEYLAREFLDAR